MTSKVRLSFISKGKWQVFNAIYNPVFAVRVTRIRGVTSVWELQDANGKVVFGDAFESLKNIRAYFNQQ